MASGDHIEQDSVGLLPAKVIYSGGFCRYGLLVSGSPAGHGQVIWLVGELPSFPNVSLISAVTHAEPLSHP